MKSYERMIKQIQQKEQELIEFRAVASELTKTASSTKPTKPTKPRVFKKFSDVKDAMSAAKSTMKEHGFEFNGTKRNMGAGAEFISSFKNKEGKTAKVSYTKGLDAKFGVSIKLPK